MRGLKIQLAGSELYYSPEHRPMNATFYCRKNPEKDLCNGLIDRHGTIEALVTAAIKLEDPNIINELQRVCFELHPFDHNAGSLATGKCGWKLSWF